METDDMNGKNHWKLIHSVESSVLTNEKNTVQLKTFFFEVGKKGVNITT